MTTSTGVRATKFLIREFVGELLYFPVWWYSRGLVVAGRGIWGWLATVNQRLGFTFHLRLVFTPMYGETGWQGRLISFFVRLMMILVRGLGVGFACGGAAVAMIMWIVIPLVSIGFLIRQFFS